MAFAVASIAYQVHRGWNDSSNDEGSCGQQIAKPGKKVDKARSAVDKPFRDPARMGAKCPLLFISVSRRSGSFR